MSRFVDWRHVACLLAIAPSLSFAQTIEDYSRAQRAAIEAALGRQAPRPEESAPSPVPASRPAPAPHAAPVAPPAEAQEVSVSGAFVSRTHVVAEVLVDGAPYIVAEGQRVPGTAWHVLQVSPDKVVLTLKPGSRVKSRTFLLATTEP